MELPPRLQLPVHNPAPVIIELQDEDEQPARACEPTITALERKEKRHQQQAQKRAAKVVRPTFRDQVASDVWIPTIEDGKEFIESTGKDLEKLILNSLHWAVKHRFGPPVKHSFKCELTTPFNQQEKSRGRVDMDSTKSD